MSPYLTTAAVYDGEPCAWLFQHDLFLHLIYGTVFSTSPLFLMFRPIHRDWLLDRLRNPATSDPGQRLLMDMAGGKGCMAVGRLFDWLLAKKMSWA